MSPPARRARSAAGSAYAAGVSAFARVRCSLRTTLIWGPLVGSLGCQSAETKACLGGYESAQALVLKVDAKSAASVGESLKSVESALTACRSANRHDEVDQLVKARNQLSAQLSALERRARRKRVQEPTAEELARLQREGDPSCPRGQAYRVKGAAKEIRCTGPLLAEMTLAQAKDHFEELGYRVTSPSASALAVERGAERYDLSFVAPDSPARCIVIVPPPGLPWQEALARAAGANPGRLKNPGSVKTARGSLDYTVDETKVIIRLGECSSAS